MARSSQYRRGALHALALGTIVSIGSGAVARADGADHLSGAPALQSANDFIPQTAQSSQFEGIGITEHLGAQLPLATPFRDQDGKDVVLGDYFKDDLPVLLTFNYSNCPMLCSQQLNALAGALPKLDLQPGKQFKIVTIDLEPSETPARARDMRRRYVDEMPADRRADVLAHWTFLLARTPSDDGGIKAVADAVGFHYRYIPERAEYAHPAALLFVSSRGSLSRYVGGIEYPADVLRASIVSAGMSEKSTSYGFVLTCFHFESGGHPHTAVVAIRIGAVAFLVLFFSALGLWRFLARSRSSKHGVARS